MKKILIAFLCTLSLPSFGEALNVGRPPVSEPVKGHNLPNISMEQWATELARRGDLDAMSFLANCYYFGKDEDIPQNFHKAFYWYSRLAEKDMPLPLNNLGFMLKTGLACEKNYEKAAQAFKASIESPLSIKIGSDMAFLNLSALYYTGKGVEKDKAKAFELFKQFVTHSPISLGLLNSVELVEKEGNIPDFVLAKFGRGRDGRFPKKEAFVEASLSELEKGFACFTRIVDKGEKQENKLLQLIADYRKLDVDRLRFKAVVDMLEDIYYVLDKPLPR